MRYWRLQINKVGEQQHISACFSPRGRQNFKGDNRCQSKKEQVASGIQWKIRSDNLCFKVVLTQQPCTRCGMLSTLFTSLLTF